MTLTKLISGFLLLLFVGCNSTKSKVAENNANNETTMEIKKKMVAEGYNEAVVIASKEANDCPYTLMIDGNKDMLVDPINLDENYKKNGTDLWVKYRPLRMQNRCNKANPVEITDIKKREE